MAAPFRKDEQVTVACRAGSNPVTGRPLHSWEIVAANVWANVQDLLPSRGEQVSNGLRLATRQTRLRIDCSIGVELDMRVTLHGRGDRVMRVSTEPALMDDRRHYEIMLEAYSS